MNNNYLLGHGGGTVYTYDTHGNMLTMPHLTTMAWDYLDQLHSASNGTFTSYYNYDTEGNRTRKVVNKGNIREERYYVNGYEIYRKYTNDVLDFERKTINISDDEKVFVRIEQKTGENPVVRYQYDNHLGSACLELDELGAIISYEEYHPFGTTSYRSGRTETEVSLKRYKYCGKERDEETGLYYYGMRYYAAWLCRFVSVDPLQFKYPELTPFQYATNRCITGIDLDGGEFVNVHENRMNEAQAKVNEAQANYNNLVNRHEGKITKSNIKKYKIESGLSRAQDKLRKETALFKEVDSYLYTLEITNKALYDKYNNLTDSRGEKIVINVELAGKSFDTRLGTVIGLRLGRVENEETGEIINYYATAKNQSLTIQLFSTSTNSENNTFPGDKTGHSYMTFANELGDIDYFFTNVKNPDSFKYFQDTTDPTSFGYTDINGAGEESEAFEKRRINEVKTYINNHPELIKKYDPIKQSISR
jgi:RHS repeat-associated protein